MATLYKQRKHKSIPENAEIVRRRNSKVARWVDGRGNRQEAPLSEDGTQIILETGPYWCKYRDYNGIIKRRSTGCLDKQCANEKLKDWVLEDQQVDSKLIRPEEIDAKQHAQKPIKDHRVDYIEALKYKTTRGRRTSPAHVDNTERCLKRIIKECKFTRLIDIDKNAVKRWMNQQEDKGEMSGRTINTYRVAIVAFCRWAVREDRMINNPLEGLGTADESETRRNRRTLATKDVGLLLSVARTRPLIEALTVRKGPRTGQLTAKVKPEVRKRLTRLGYERYLIDLTMLYTGLRRIEIERLTVSDLHLNCVIPYIDLKRSTTKNAEESEMPIRRDLAPLLSEWVASKLPGAKLFHIPRKYVTSLDHDLAAAKIDKTDEKGRTFDVHCFRHQFATELQHAGVSSQMIKTLMRHSEDSVTDRYLHTNLKEKSGAIELLPDYVALAEPAIALATGTDDIPQHGDLIGMPNIMPRHAQNHAQNQSLPDNACQEQIIDSDTGEFISDEIKEACQPLTSLDKTAGGGNRTRMTSLEGWSFTIKLHPHQHLTLMANCLMMLSL